MELWIRSQNKLNLTKVNSVIIDYNYQKKIVANYMEFNGDEDYVPLGEYDTEERALEVLDEIQDVIKLKQSWQLNENSFKVCIQKGGYDEEQVMKIIDKMYVYEMPKE